MLAGLGFVLEILFINNRFDSSGDKAVLLDKRTDFLTYLTKGNR